MHGLLILECIALYIVVYTQIFQVVCEQFVSGYESSVNILS